MIELQEDLELISEPEDITAQLKEALEYVSNLDSQGFAFITFCFNRAIREGELMEADALAMAEIWDDIPEGIVVEVSDQIDVPADELEYRVYVRDE